MPEEQQPLHRQYLCKNHTHQLVSLVKANPEPHPVLGNKRASNLSQAVNELRTVNQVLSQPHSCMQGNEASGSYTALALDKLPQREAIMAQNDIQNILTRYRLGMRAAPSPCNYTSSIPGNHTPPTYSWPRFTPTDSPSPFTSTVNNQYTAEPERQEEVGSFADVLPEAWKMSNDVQ
jgi:hypothetical protein